MQVALPKKTYTNKIRNFQGTMKLCDERGDEVVPKTLQGTLVNDNSILWAIPADDPETVKYYPILSGEEYTPCNEKDALRPDGSKRRANMIHHNYLVEGKPVLCAGESRKSLVTGRVLTNKSGHYTPDNECLPYAKSLFEAKGNTIHYLYGMKGGKTKRQKKTKKDKSIRQYLVCH
jgi:hypothetical protein